MRTVFLAFALLFVQVPQDPSLGSIEGMVVQFDTSIPVAGARVTIGTAFAVTDASGRFAFRNLQPARYFIFATHPNYVAAPSGTRGQPDSRMSIALGPGQFVTDVVVGLVQKAAVSGRVYMPSGAPAKGAMVQVLRYTYQEGRRILILASTAVTDGAGEYRLAGLVPGAYVLRAVPSNGSGPDANLPVYFPNTVDAFAASTIDIAAGIEYNGVDFNLREERAARVRGQIINGFTGQPEPAATVTLVPRRGNVTIGSSQRGTPSNMGEFEFLDIVPGSYDLVASVTAGANGRLAGSVPIEVSSSDIDDVRVVPQPQLSLNGKLRLENLPVDAAPFSLGGVRLELRREPYTPELLILIPKIAADGGFTFTDVTPGDYRLKVTTPGATGYIKYAHFGSLNALNAPFPISGPGEFDIVLALDFGAVGAVILGEDQKPVVAATVVLVPDPPYRPRLDLYYSSSSDALGRARFDAVAPADYKMFAWDDVPAEAWLDPDFLRAYESRGTPVHVGQGSTQVLQLLLIPRL